MQFEDGTRVLIGKIQVSIGPCMMPTGATTPGVPFWRDPVSRSTLRPSASPAYAGDRRLGAW